MTRGTTVTQEFELPFETSGITKLNIAYKQNEQVILEKTLADCSVSDKKIVVRFTEQQSLLFEAGKNAFVQLRLQLGNDTLASNIMCFEVNPIIKEGVLNG